MIAARRSTSSRALERALEHARRLGKPLLVAEPLRIDYRWACPRFHQFVIEGMADNAAAFEAAGVTYLPYVEPEKGRWRELLADLAARAAVVVTDVVPTARSVPPVPHEAVDSSGVLPLSEVPRAFTTAASFRRFLQKVLPPWLERLPDPEPLRGYDLGRAPIPRGWQPRTEMPALSGPGPVPYRGGAVAGGRVVDALLADRLERYEDRNHPDEDVASGLSPYLHFGHVSAPEVVRRVLEREGWHPGRLGEVTGSKGAWWGVSPAAEAFLDQLVTWRELGAAFCHHVPRFDRYDTLPDWALATLAEHASDPRPHLYDLEALAAAETHDEVWNAAQRQLLAEGRIHNYLRMLWGKKVLEWSPSPEIAWERLIELNNRYAVDGRDPNSYSGIAWVFGRFDRAWGPERPIYGKVRYMTSDSTRRKLRMGRYLGEFGKAR